MQSTISDSFPGQATAREKQRDLNGPSLKKFAKTLYDVKFLLSQRLSVTPKNSVDKNFGNTINDVMKVPKNVHQAIYYNKFSRSYQSIEFRIVIHTLFFKYTLFLHFFSDTLLDCEQNC